MTGPPVVAVTGLRFEAAIAAGVGVQVVCGQSALLSEYLEAALTPDCRGIISFGIVGGLIDDLRPGEWVIARTLVDGARRITCDVPWSKALLRALPGARHVDVAATETPVATPDAKRALYDATGAAAVDMESGIAARIAHARAMPFVCCRVVADPVGRSLPAAALAGVRSDGTTNMLAALRSLASRPGELPLLLAVARDAWVARRALASGRRQLGPGLGYPS